MALTFNIVYTPGTVPYLTFFVPSLLKWSDCRFRLVANGCLSPERRLLQQLCAEYDRLSYRTIPTNGTADHGTVLNYLQALTNEDHFCFMDSDLFATGEFLPELQPQVDSRAGVFSGTPIWMTLEQGILPADFETVSGVHHHTDDGICLGGSYFAIYDNRVLTDCLQSTGIGFQTYQWRQLPPDVRQSLASCGWQKQGYDTAKVLNLLLQRQGHELQYTDVKSLCHIGGFSFVRPQDQRPAGWKSRLAAHLVNGPFGRILRPVQEKWRSHAAFRHSVGLSAREQQAIMARRTSQRDPTRRYFLDLLTALAGGRPLPERLAIGVPEIDEKMERATDLIGQQYAEVLSSRSRSAA